MKGPAVELKVNCNRPFPSCHAIFFKPFFSKQGLVCSLSYKNLFYLHGTDHENLFLCYMKAVFQSSH